MVNQIIYCIVLSICLVLFMLIMFIILYKICKLINVAHNPNRNFHIVAFFGLLLIFVLGTVSLVSLLITNCKLI